VARFLDERGYHASALIGGFDAWKNAGYPLEASA
jgi:rhodanese-related sulfurtransferase